MSHNENAERLCELLLSLVRELVDQPNSASVDSTIGSGGRVVILTVRTADGDLGKVIGRKGRTAEAIRFLMETMAARHRIRIVIEIDDDR